MTRFSCSSASATGATASAKDVCGASTPGIDDLLVRVEQVLDDHHRVVPLLERLPVEVRGELGQRLGVVVDRDRDVLLRRRELVADLLVQRVARSRARRDSTAARSASDAPVASGPMAGVPQTLKGRSFTRIAAWSRDELETLLDLADELKAERARRQELRVLPGRTIGLIFHKPSTRTRVAFEVGIAELGGMALFLPAAELQLARGESYRDTALVLSRFLSALMIRTFEQAEVEEFAEHAVDPGHQRPHRREPPAPGARRRDDAPRALRDARRRPARVRRATGTTSATRSCASPRRFGMELRRGDAARATSRAPSSSRRRAEDARENGGSVELTTDPREAARGAACRLHRRLDEHGPGRASATDDCATSSRTASTRTSSLSPTAEGVAMHCLPAHVGEEISADVLYGPRCLAWEQAENRLHTQKALMALVIR